PHRVYVPPPDGRKLDEPWGQTQFAEILKDKGLQALAEQLVQQFNTGSDMYRRLGLGWDEVRAVAQGEATWALVQPAPGKHAAVVLIDVSGKADQARSKIGEAMTKRGLKGHAQAFDGASATAYDLNGRKVFHLIKDDVFVAADDATVLQGVLARWAAGKKDSLEDLPAFQGVFKHFEAAGKEPVHLRW